MSPFTQQTRFVELTFKKNILQQIQVTASGNQIIAQVLYLKTITINFVQA